MTRAQILADTLARLEAERYAPPRRPQMTPAAPPPLPTRDAEAAKNARTLMEAITEPEDPYAAEWDARQEST